jgi:conjugal transfer pilus assembly protein TraE
MNNSFREKNLRSLIFQRNVFLAMALLLAISSMVTCLFLFVKNDRIIITPPMIEKEFWVEGNQVSATYLEQFGIFLGQLLFNKSSHSASSQRAVILRHTDTAYVGALRQKLVEEEEMLKKQNASYVFYPEKISVEPNALQVLLAGERITFAAGKQVSSKKESYVLTFGYAGSQLLLKSVSSVGGE